MKKTYLTVAVACLLGGSMMFTSCIGSFSLTNKMLAWNKNISNKFVNELVFIAFWVLPVYEVSALADLIVLNSIEFWSGSNPVAQGKRIIDGTDGQRYMVISDARGYTIRSLSDGSEVRLDYNTADRSWTYTVDGQTATIFAFVDDTHVAMPAPDGTTRVVELSDAGLMAYQAIAGMPVMACR